MALNKLQMTSRSFWCFKILQIIEFWAIRQIFQSSSINSSKCKIYKFMNCTFTIKKAAISNAIIKSVRIAIPRLLKFVQNLNIFYKKLIGKSQIIYFQKYYWSNLSECSLSLALIESALFEWWQIERFYGYEWRY